MATDCIDYNFTEIEKHWQKFWEKNHTFSVKEYETKKKFYVLDMFPYPSGSGLHIGHPEGYTASDILTRYKKSCGFNVLHPIGWDAFGLPAEQHAVKTGTHPAKNTQENIENFRRQIKSFGFAIDWDREINTTDPEYFKWTQWIFLQLFKHGLAYVDERPVWWCEELKCVLANEEVVNGVSERGEHPVERRNLRQWVLRITKYADRLLEGLKTIDWPESTKRQQVAWIGKSKGSNVNFKIKNSTDELIVYTTRIDTLFGVSYISVAPEHQLLSKITTQQQKKCVQEYIETVKSKSDLERTDLAKTKSGVFTGSYAINPINNQKVPIWVADYVLASYGTGAVMAVPAHDERDFEFAKKYELDICEVVVPEKGKSILPYCEDGILQNSKLFDDLTSAVARDKITQYLTERELGSVAVNYKLRDWLFSRQRYWGEPIPIVWVSEDGYDKIKNESSPLCEFLPDSPVSVTIGKETLCAIPLSSKNLPLELPKVQSYLPSSNGESPLANVNSWVNVFINPVTGTITNSCKGDQCDYICGKRETNTMPQWAGSCWYYLRYMSPNCDMAFVDSQAEKYWQCPDFYIGGAEHAVLHLLYARFWHQFLFDIGLVTTTEPFQKVFHQGIILGEDGIKMSKSKGNVINPDDIISQYGADSLRLYEMFLGPLEAMKPWNTKGIEGVVRFLKKVWYFVVSEEGSLKPFVRKDSADILKVLHETIKKVGDDIENLRFNTAISQLMVLLNSLQKVEKCTKKTINIFIIMLAPFAPHIAEELWARIGNKGSVSEAKWPEFNQDFLVQNNCKIMLQVNGKLRGEVEVVVDISEKDVAQLALADPNVQKFIADKPIKKIIFVQNKILNIVVG